MGYWMEWLSGGLTYSSLVTGSGLILWAAWVIEDCRGLVLRIQLTLTGGFPDVVATLTSNDKA
jgi:hypothetical protein